MIVEGQVHGGLAQGIGQALLEGAVYDGNGQLVTASFMDYTMPRADDLPSFKLNHTTTLCPGNPLGVKGCGEAGAIGASAAVINAITDAIGNNKLEMPATPDRCGTPSTVSAQPAGSETGSTTGLGAASGNWSQSCIRPPIIAPAASTKRRRCSQRARRRNTSPAGHTLIPVMKQRLASPSDVIDLARIKDLIGIDVGADTVTIKAATTHYDVASSAPVQKAIAALAHLASLIGDPAMRHRGTIGGSIANNDPAADYPAAVLALGATVKTNKRSIAADDFFKGLFATALEDGEIITQVSFPIPAKAGLCEISASRLALRPDRRVRGEDQGRRGPRRRHRRVAERRHAGARDRSRPEDQLVGLRARQRRNFRRRPDERHPGLAGLSRQPDQGDGAARGRRRRLIAVALQTMPAARSDARRTAFRTAAFREIRRKRACQPRLKARQFS